MATPLSATTSLDATTALVAEGLETLQEVRPDADTTTTGWSATPLWSKINDASDSTIVTGTLA